MATTTRQQQRVTPLVAYNYRVIVGDLSMRFSRVEGLSWERKAVTYRDGLSFLDGEEIQTYRVNNFTPLTLQQGVIPMDNSLLEWLQKGDSRTLQLLLCQSNGDPVLCWRAGRAYPIKLSSSTLVASTNDILIDSLELLTSDWSINPAL